MSDDTQASYDRLAAEYAARIYGELVHKPLDRELLDRFAERLRGQGPVCETWAAARGTWPATSTSAA